MKNFFTRTPGGKFYMTSAWARTTWKVVCYTILTRYNEWFGEILTEFACFSMCIKRLIDLYGWALVFHLAVFDLLDALLFNERIVRVGFIISPSIENKIRSIYRACVSKLRVNLEACRFIWMWRKWIDRLDEDNYPCKCLLVLKH